MKKIWVLLILLAGLPACSLFRAKTVPYPERIIFPLRQTHSLGIAGEVRESLLLREDHLYFTTYEGRVYSIDARERKVEWEFRMNAAGASRVCLGEERIYAWDAEGTVYCLDAAGNLMWKAPLSESLHEGGDEGSAHLYLATTAGELAALDKAEGKTVWRFKVDGEIHCDPACHAGVVAFGCEDGYVYVLSSDGRLLGRFAAGSAVRGSVLLDENRLYFGSSDHFFYCVALPDFKLKWKVRTGGGIESPHVLDHRRIYVIGRNNVLYCLARKSGTVLWWSHVPARSRFRPELIDDRITVASLSKRLVCFDVRSGEERGRFDAGLELRANPVWFAPYLVLAHFDPDTGHARLSFLEKEVKVVVVFSKTDPQRLNEEIQVKVEVSGFYLPQYEFYLTRHLMLRFGLHLYIPVQTGEARQVVQERSENASWDWFPEEPGLYVIEVQVNDEKEEASSKAAFLIEKGDSNATG
jgi:outer membrane protein assembly factor BamB